MDQTVPTYPYVLVYPKTAPRGITITANPAAFEREVARHRQDAEELLNELPDQIAKLSLLLEQLRQLLDGVDAIAYPPEEELSGPAREMAEIARSIDLTSRGFVGGLYTWCLHYELIDLSRRVLAGEVSPGGEAR